MRRCVKFFEKPGDVKEKEIQKTLLDFFVAINDKNIKKLNELIADDAQIDSRITNKIINKADFIQQVEKENLKDLSCIDVLIRIISEREAICFYTMGKRWPHSIIMPRRHCTYLKNIDCKWKVTKTEYIV